MIKLCTFNKLYRFQFSLLFDCLTQWQQQLGLDSAVACFTTNEKYLYYGIYLCICSGLGISDCEVVRRISTYCVCYHYHSLFFLAIYLHLTYNLYRCPCISKTFCWIRNKQFFSIFYCTENLFYHLLITLSDA